VTKKDRATASQEAEEPRYSTNGDVLYELIGSEKRKTARDSKNAFEADVAFGERVGETRERGGLEGLHDARGKKADAATKTERSCAAQPVGRKRTTRLEDSTPLFLLHLL